MVGCHALLTRLPLSAIRRWFLVRLACVKPAASVRSEPESNSQVESVLPTVSLFTDVTYKYVALVRSKKIYEFLNSSN